MPDLVDEIVARMDARFDDVLSLARDLIRAPSENHPPTGDEGNAQRVLERWLVKQGLECALFEPSAVPDLDSFQSYLPNRDYTDRPNLVTVLPGAGGGRSLMLTGHIDTVDRRPDHWPTAGPFAGELHGDRLYGRGSYDMKAALASAAVLMSELSAAALPLRGDLVFGSVVDEERCGGNGTLALLANGYTADAAVLMEMTDLVVCHASKGVKVYEVVVRGAGGHSSVPQAKSPIEGIAHVVVGLRELGDQLNALPVLSQSYFAHATPRRVTIGVLRTDGSQNDWDYGTVTEARVRFVVLPLPGDSEEHIDRAVVRWLSDLWAKDSVLAGMDRPELASVSHFVLPSETGPDAPIVGTTAQAAMDILGRPIRVDAAEFACDAGILSDVFKIPTVIFGPAGDNAHTADEYVSVESLRDFTRSLTATVVAWCA